MNILILNYEWPPLGGGGAPVAEGLARKYVEFGHNVDVVTMRYRDQPSEENRDSIRLHRVWCWRKKMETCETPEMISYVISALWPALRLCHRLKPSVIHCHFAVPTGLLAWMVHRLTRIPYIVTLHGSDLPGHNPTRFTLAHRFTKPVIRKVCASAAKVVSPSQFLADHLVNTVGDYDLEVIPNGIDCGRFVFGKENCTPSIMMSGRLLKLKGFLDVLEALRDVPGDYEVRIAGDGPMREAMERAAEELPQKVSFHGWLDSASDALRELYESSTIFALPSARENAPVSMLEAMAAGMAVVTSNASGCRETIGDAGLLVPAGDIPALAEALLSLIAAPARVAELGRKARRRVEQRFDSHKLAQRYADLLWEVARKA